ncbi:hypothetical protein COCNU_scaffold005738G000030 [Cocos nucifera]|nr:hypothetical protein [Cocos nucifera]
MQMGKRVESSPLRPTDVRPYNPNPETKPTVVEDGCSRLSWEAKGKGKELDPSPPCLNDARSSPSRTTPSSHGPTEAAKPSIAEDGRTWSQVVQGTGWFNSKMERATENDIEALQEKFTNMVVFSDEELRRISPRCKSIVLGKGFFIDFVQKETRTRWNVEGDFQVIPLSRDFLLFSFPSEEAKSKVLEQDPWSLAGQLLALDCWHPTFKPTKDAIRYANVWLRPSDLPLVV